MGEERFQGVLKLFFPEKAYGFVTRHDNPEEDVFVHKVALEKSGIYEIPPLGTPMSYSIHVSPKGQHQANFLKIEGGMAPAVSKGFAQIHQVPAAPPAPAPKPFSGTGALAQSLAEAQPIVEGTPEVEAADLICLKRETFDQVCQLVEWKVGAAVANEIRSEAAELATHWAPALNMGIARARRPEVSVVMPAAKRPRPGAPHGLVASATPAGTGGKGFAPPAFGGGGFGLGFAAGQPQQVAQPPPQQAGQQAYSLGWAGGGGKGGKDGGAGDERKKWVSGTVVSVLEKHAYIRCPMLQGLYENDVYIHRNVLDKAAEANGVEIEKDLELVFPLHISNQGKPQASLPVFLADRQFVGRIARWNEEKGFGFVTVEEIPGQDIYIHKSICDKFGFPAAINMPVSFQLHISKQFCPQATNLAEVIG
mmetsp:Transcript_33094/g.73984  ORF Transcript_33094/g.73984 Transcript_33094/m.73984 type:complete len:422 (+) Transcript_33094:49-1314(+)